MTTTTKDTWVNNAAAIIPPMVLPTGYAGLVGSSIYHYELDLTTKNGGLLLLCLGRLTATGLTGNVFVNVRRKQLSSVNAFPGDYVGYTGGNTTGATTIAVASSVAIGQTIIPMTANPTALGSAGNANILFMGVTTTYTAVTVTAANTLFEFARIAAAFNATASLGATAIWLDEPSQLARTLSEVTSNLAEIIGPLFLEGGAKYDICFNAASVSAGGPVAIAAYWEELTCLTST